MGLGAGLGLRAGLAGLGGGWAGWAGLGWAGRGLGCYRRLYCTTSVEMLRNICKLKRESAHRHNEKQKIKEYEARHKFKIRPEERTEELLSEVMMPENL